MKKYLILILLICLSATANADMTRVPNVISAPVILYDEGNNLVSDGDYKVTIVLKDGLGQLVYQEEQSVRVKDGIAHLAIGGGMNPEDGATAGLNSSYFITDQGLSVEILVEGQAKPQLVTYLGSQPYSFVSEYALTVAKDAITSDQIRNGSITEGDLSPELLQMIQSESTAPSPIEGDSTAVSSLSAKSITVNSDLGLNNAGGNSVDKVLKGLDTAIDTLRDVNIKQGISTLRSEAVLRDGSNPMTGDFNLGGKNITNIGNNNINLQTTLSSLTDGTALDSRYVNVSGDKMTGDLDLDGHNILNIGTVDGVNIENLNTTVSGHTTAIQNMQTTVNNHSTSITNLENTVGEHTTNITNVQNTVNNIINGTTQIDGTDVSQIKDDLNTHIGLTTAHGSDGAVVGINTLTDAIDSVRTEFRGENEGKPDISQTPVQSGDWVVSCTTPLVVDLASTSVFDGSDYTSGNLALKTYVARVGISRSDTNSGIRASLKYEFVLDARQTALVHAFIMYYDSTYGSCVFASNGLTAHYEIYEVTP